MARFMDNIKNTSSTQTWSQFIIDAEKGDSLNSFDNFGTKSSNLKDTFRLLGDTLDKYTKLLIAAINPNKNLTDEQVRDSIQSLISCYLADTLENNINTLLIAAGRAATGLTYLGPCEIEARTCLSGASQSYNQNLIACGFGGAGVAGLPKGGGWWGLAAGFACFVVANNSYNNAKWACIDNYVDCVN